MRIINAEVRRQIAKEANQIVTAGQLISLAKKLDETYGTDFEAEARHLHEQNPLGFWLSDKQVISLRPESRETFRNRRIAGEFVEASRVTPRRIATSVFAVAAFGFLERVQGLETKGEAA